jgi:hypothetical protein
MIGHPTNCPCDECRMTDSIPSQMVQTTPTTPDVEREHIKDNVLKAIMEWNTLERQAHERERREGGKGE